MNPRKIIILSVTIIAVIAVACFAMAHSTYNGHTVLHAYNPSVQYSEWIGGGAIEWIGGGNAELQ